MVDAVDLKSTAARRVGSRPTGATGGALHHVPVIGRPIYSVSGLDATGLVDRRRRSWSCRGRRRRGTRLARDREPEEPTIPHDDRPSAPTSWRAALPRVGISETSELPAAALAAVL